jgi:RNA polymerase sigma factor (TIGR02999 family)
MTQDDSSLRDGSAAAVLRTLQTDDPATAEELVPVVYDELRALARRQLSREARNPTLHTTELVHEAYLRLARGGGVTDRGRAYFFAAAAQAMRRVLIDSARRRTASKRGGDPTRVTFADDLSAVDAYAVELLDLDRALSDLEAKHPRAARVVECRFFGGLTVEDTAATLEISPRTVKSDWALARAWLHRALSQREGGPLP